MLDIITKNFFREYAPLKYISCWSTDFSPANFKRDIKFCPVDPRYVVVVTLLGLIPYDKLESKDIQISLGSNHSGVKTEEHIKSHENELVELCKKAKLDEFLLDSKNMKIITREDFTEDYPIHGLNTPFIFTKKDEDCFYILTASPTYVSSSTLYAWFIGFIMSYKSCTKSIIMEQTDDAKLMLRAIGLHKFFRGDIKAELEHVDISVSRLSYPSNGELLIDAPANISRLNHLLKDAREKRKKIRNIA